METQNSTCIFSPLFLGQGGPCEFSHQTFNYLVNKTFEINKRFYQNPKNKVENHAAFTLLNQQLNLFELHKIIMVGWVNRIQIILFFLNYMIHNLHHSPCS